MNKNKLIICLILIIFITGMILAPASATKYKHKKSITVTVKDGKKTIKIKCKYNKGLKQYIGHKKKYKKTYDVNIVYEKNNKMQYGKKGWWTTGTNAGLSDYAKIDYKHNKYHPITRLKLHYL